MGLLEDTIASVAPPDAAAVAAAHERQSRLTKPAGSLGQLEDLSVRLAGIAGQCPPPVPAPAAVAVFAADHGVHAQGVTPWPQEVTAQMVANFLAGGAVVNAIATQVGARVCVVDVGVASDLAPHPDLVVRKVRRGTADMTAGPAMDRGEAVRALGVGIQTARDLVDAGHRCLATGDMGIANTTASAALIAAMTGTDPSRVTGRGTGIDDATWQRKVDVVRKALARHAPDSDDPIGVLAAVGGLEHAAIAGLMLGGAALRVPVVLDGVIAAAAALVAQALAPDVVGALVAGHLSTEPGAGLAMATLGLRPLLDLHLRLGEGTGAALAIPLVQAAARVLRDVATFDTAGVSGEATPRRSGTTAGGTHPRDGVAPASLPREAIRRVLILGGARSGKSATAQGMLADVDHVRYVATGPVADGEDLEWTQRVREHKQNRPDTWETVETLEIEPLIAGSGGVPVLIECLATWLAGVMDHCGLWSGAPGADAALAARVDDLVAAWRSARGTVVMVSNEVGSGVVPHTRAGRRFRDELGRLNTRLAAESDEVWLCTAGIAQRLR